MEKIYMEENKSQKNRSIVDFSVVLSFAVAFFAIFSLVAVGFNKVSYAAPDSDLGSNFTFYEKKSNTSEGHYFVYAAGSTNPMNTKVNFLYADSAMTVKVYCVERNVAIVSGLEYTREQVIDDYALLTLLSTGESYLKSQGVTNDLAITWIMQSAIWVHMYNKEAAKGTVSESNPHYIPNVNEIKNATALSLNDGDLAGDKAVSLGASPTKTPGALVNALVSSAEGATQPVNSLTVNKSDDEISKLDSGDYMTSKISVSASSNLKNFTVSLSGIDGIYMVDEDGNKIDSNKSFNPSDSFYVVIPKDKVSETAQTLKVNVNGTFTGLDGYRYMASGDSSKQKVVTVRSFDTEVSKGIDFEIVGAPDTGMNTAQTIYFIGLVVLLCGVGIVYANAKPVESKQ